MDSEHQSDFHPEPGLQSQSSEHEQLGEAELHQIPGAAHDSVAELAASSRETSPLGPDGNPIAVSDQFWKLDPKNIQVERISGLIFSSVLLTAALIGLAVVWFGQGFNSTWFVIAIPVALLLLALFVLAIYWPSLNHNRSSWRLDAEGLEIRQGVLWRHRITIPLGRVQHADVSQGPLQRQFGVAKLTIHTAGTQHASIPLEGLAHATAIELRDLVVGQKKDQHVV